MRKRQKARRKPRSETVPARYRSDVVSGNDLDDTYNGIDLPSIKSLTDRSREFRAEEFRHNIEIDYADLREVGLFPPVDQQRRIAEQFRLIKRPLIDNASGMGAYQSDDANLIMVTSALPGDGKTFNCINLALSMATEKDKSVVLVDADVAKPHISRLLGLEDRPGLIDLLTDMDRSIQDTLVATDVRGLSILPAGREDEHATELLASSKMAALAEALSTTCADRFVIFDSPPLLVTSEARVLAKSMGQIVLVVCAGKTPQAAVVEAASGFDPNKPASVVVNRFSQSFSGAYYGVYGAPYGGSGGYPDEKEQSVRR